MTREDLIFRIRSGLSSGSWHYLKCENDEREDKFLNRGCVDFMSLARIYLMILNYLGSGSYGITRVHVIIRIMGWLIIIFSSLYLL